MLAGDTTKLRITDMAKTGMLRTGDIWRYSRTFGKVSTVTTVKKELKVKPNSNPPYGSAPTLATRFL
jgi:hypothetical protein